MIQAASWVLTERIGRAIVELIVGIVAARALGPEGMGVLSFALANLAMAITIARAGLDIVVVKEIAQRPDQASVIVSGAMLTKALSSAVAFLLLGTFALAIAERSVVAWTTIALAVGLLWTPLDAVDLNNQANENFRRGATVRLGASLLSGAVRCYAVLQAFSLPVIGAAFATEMVIAAVLFVYLQGADVRRALGQVGAPAECRALFVAGMPFVLSAFVNMAQSRADLIVVGFVLGQDANGQIAVAARLVEPCALIPMALITTMQPAFAQLFVKDRAEFKRSLEELYRLIVIYSACCILVFHVFGGWLTEFLYGHEYSPVASILTVYSTKLLLAGLGMARTIYLVNHGLMNWVVLTSLVGCACAFLLSATLSASLGLFGAAVSSPLSFLLSTLLLDFANRRTRSNSLSMLHAVLTLYRFRLALPNRTQ